MVASLKPCLTRAVVLLLVAASGVAQTLPTASPPQNKKPDLQRIQGERAGAINVPPQGLPASPVLTIQADPPNPVPNQSVRFIVTSDAPLYRRVFVFDWGDHSPQDRQKEQPVAHHTYSTSGSYTVRVTAESLATNGIGPLTGELGITVREVKLVADPPNPRVGDSVTLTATLDPSDESAQYSFDFGDGDSVDSGSSNKAEHPYREAREFYPSVVATLGNGAKVASGKIDLAIAAATSTGIPGGTRKRKEPAKPARNIPSPITNTNGPRTGYWLLILGGALGILVLWRLLRRGAKTIPTSNATSPSPRLRTILHPDAGVHEMTRIQESGPHASLMLKSGMDPGEDEVTFHKSTAEV